MWQAGRLAIRVVLWFEFEPCVSPGVGKAHRADHAILNVTRCCGCALTYIYRRRHKSRLKQVRKSHPNAFAHGQMSYCNSGQCPMRHAGGALDNEAFSTGRG